MLKTTSTADLYLLWPTKNFARNHQIYGMIKIPKRSLDRLKEGLKRFQKIVPTLVARDVSEADTVTVVKDMLNEVFGFDKYMELTSEQQIRGTYCDLAVKIDGKIKYLIEVKAAAIKLNDSHLKQAINYGAQEGIEWVALTNAQDWVLYRIRFAQPIDFEEVARFSLTDLDLKKDDDQKKLFLLCREAITEGVMDLYHKHSKLFNNYTIAQVMMTDQVVSVVRREFRKLFPEFKVDKDDLSEMITEGIFKRDVLDSENAKEAEKLVRKEQRKLDRKKAKETAQKTTTSTSSQD